MVYRNRAPYIFMLLLLALAGCVLLDKLGEPEEVFGFSHAVHAEEGLECLDCHRKSETADEPGIPSMRQCMLCHEDIDEEKPPEKRIETLFADKKYLSTKRSELSEEVIFPHLAHATSEYDCGVCHAGIETNQHVADLPRVSMDDCQSCHQEDGVANECATCHQVIDDDWKPQNHAFNWTKLHGQRFRAASDRLVNRCDMCHSQSTCNTCHDEVPPDNHTNFWRRRGHLVHARMDRDSCSTCHRADFCSRCHDEARPTSHVGMWGGTLSTHCVSCHLPVRGEGCITCHKATPSHLQATPLPSDPRHSPGQNCRLCHGVSASLPHVDNGSECIACHM